MIYLDPRYYFKYSRNVSSSNNVLPLCSSLDNYFIPVFAGTDGSFIEANGKKAMLYHIKQSRESIYNFPTTITKFVEIIHRGRQYGSFIEPYTGIVYYTMKHFIYVIHEGNIVPLYCLCYSRDDIFSVNREQPDFTKLFLILNNELLKVEHKVLYLRIKAMTKYFSGLGVNIIYTNNPKDLYFKLDVSETKFTSINERIAYINRIKQIAGLHYEEPKKQVTQSIINPTTIVTPIREVRASSAIPDPEIWGLF